MEFYALLQPTRFNVTLLAGSGRCTRRSSAWEPQTMDPGVFLSDVRMMLFGEDCVPKRYCISFVKKATFRFIQAF